MMSTNNHLFRKIVHPRGSVQSGLTLVELMVTMAIVAVLLSLAVPSMRRTVADWRLSNAVNAFNGSMRVARSEAIARGRVVRLCRTTSNAPDTCTSATSSNDYSSGWLVFVDANNDGTFNTGNGDVDLIRQEAFSGISGITPNEDEVALVFLPTGIMRATQGLGINFDSTLFTNSTDTPWARKALCVTPGGQVLSETDSDDC